MLPTKSEYKIIDLKNKEAGVINIEILPCNGQGQPITQAPNIANPKTDLLDKTINFIIKISTAKIANPVFEA